MFNMTSYELFVFVLCAVVFTIFTLVFSIMLGYLMSLYVKLIRHGVYDKKIKTEYQKREKKKPSKLGTFLDRLVSIVLCLVMCGIFAFSVYLQVTESKAPNGVPSIKVVKSASMATKHEKNTYLAGIDNQVQTFDMIMTYHIPEEKDLKLYDIVMYEKDGEFILHRIVGIEEPNEKHPNERWYTLQGDAVRYPDTDPVLYSQMRGIYRDEKVPFVGSFVMFMQSPAGYLCILLVVIAMIATPIMERRLEREKQKRMDVIRRSLGLTRLCGPDLRRMILDICGKSLIFFSVGFLYWLMLKRYYEKED